MRRGYLPQRRLFLSCRHAITEPGEHRIVGSFLGDNVLPAAMAMGRTETEVQMRLRRQMNLHWASEFNVFRENYSEQDWLKAYPA